MKKKKNENIKNFKSYNGNPNLKKSGVAIEWTPDMVQEYMKCSADPIYFIETYMKIINVDEGLVNFNMYGYQKKMVDSMATNRQTIIATARQAGKSTSTCGFILWYILFQPGKTVALLANKGETAREILGKIQLAYMHLPLWLQPGVEEWNKGSFELENNSRVIAAATSTDAIRGYSINCLFIDEAAHIEHWDEFYTSVLPTITSGKTTKVILVSTPLGMNHFYKLWQHANDGKNEFNPIKVMWHDVPGRDQKWADEYLATIGYDREKFAQEMEVEFLGSSGTLIAGWKLKELVDQVPFSDLGDRQDQYRIYKYAHAIEDHIYAIVADTSRGKGLDYSAFHVIDVTTMPYNQCAVFHDHYVTPIDYAEVIYQFAKIYNDAHILVEINDIGQQVADHIFYEYEYENVISTVNAGRLGKKVSGGFAQNTDRGIRTTQNVKSIGCSIIKLLVEQNQLVINDFNTIQEFSTFSKKGKSFEAEEGCHDDLVMGLVLFGWLTDQAFFKEINNINTLSRLRDKSEDQIMSELLPFGYIDDGRIESIDEIPLIQEIPFDHWLLGDHDSNF